MPFSPSKLAMCHLSHPRNLDFYLRVKQGLVHGLALWLLGSHYPSTSRDPNRADQARYGWGDYKNAAALREITQGEG